MERKHQDKGQNQPQNDPDQDTGGPWSVQDSVQHLRGQRRYARAEILSQLQLYRSRNKTL